MTRRRLLVISHACVTAINQQFFLAVAEAGEFALDLVVPARWRSDYSGALMSPGTWDASRGNLYTVPVLLPGNIPLHCYAGSLRRLLGTLRPDIVYVHHEPYALATAQAFAARGRGLPMGFYSAQNLHKAYPPPFAAMERWVYRNASFAFPVTQTVETVIRAKGFRGPAAIVPPGFDGTLFNPKGERENYPVPTVGFAGRLVPEKGIATLLEAFRRLPEDVGLAIVGNGPLGGRIDELRRERPNVFWYPEAAHPDVPRYLRGLALLVLPSLTTPGWTEQFGRVLVEAAACGVPAIGSDSGEIPRLIADLGAGTIVPEGDAAALAAAIAAALADPARRAKWRQQGLINSRRFENHGLAHAFSTTLHSALERRNHG